MTSKKRDRWVGSLHAKIDPKEREARRRFLADSYARERHLLDVARDYMPPEHARAKPEKG